MIDLPQELNHPEILSEITLHGKQMEIPEGTTILKIGQYIKVVPIVLKGSIKVSRKDGEGGELFLYYILTGETCAMTLQSCRVNEPSEIVAVAEEETVIVAIPIPTINRWIEEIPFFKKYVLKTYSERFNELLKALDSVVFHQLDERLLNFIREKSNLKNSQTIHISHQQIAHDLHSTREVISRILKQFEKKGILQLGRNKITLM